MKRMASFILLLLFFALLAAPVFGAEQPEEELGLSPEVGSFLDSYGDQAELLESLTLQGLWERFCQTVKGQLTSPLRMFGRLAGCLVLAAVAKAVCADLGSQKLEPQIDMAILLAACLFVCQPLLQLLEEIGSAVLQCRTFVSSFVPVFATVMASCGQPAASAVYTGFFLSSVLLAANLITGILLPFLKIYMALTVAGGISTTADLSGVASLISRFVKWGLGLIATVFGAVVGLQSLLAGAADSVALKAGKFLVGSGVPVIGGAVSDAISTVYAGLKVVKGTAGAAGICVMVALFAPILIRCFVYYLALSAAAAAAAVTGNQKVGGVFRGFCSCLELYGAILIFFAVMITLATALMILLGLGQ